MLHHIWHFLHDDSLGSNLAATAVWVALAAVIGRLKVLPAWRAHQTRQAQLHQHITDLHRHHLPHLHEEDQ